MNIFCSGGLLPSGQRYIHTFSHHQIAHSPNVMCETIAKPSSLTLVLLDCSQLTANEYDYNHAKSHGARTTSRGRELDKICIPDYRRTLIRPKGYLMKTHNEV